jgi:hypothetical protein
LSLLAILFVLVVPASAQVLVWANTYHYSGIDVATQVACDRQGNVIVSGYSEAFGSSYADIATIKYNPDGETLWVRRFGYYPNRYDSAAAIAADADDNIFVLGTSQDSAYRNTLGVIKYLPNGDTSWVRYRSDSAYDCFGKSLALDPAGNIYVAGYRSLLRPPRPTRYDILVAKYAPSGNLLWERFYNVPTDSATPHRDHQLALCLDPLGNVIVTAPKRDTLAVGTPWGYPQNFLTIKFNSTGDTVWTREYNSAFGLDDYPVAIASDDSANIYVCGASDGDGTQYDYCVLKYTPDGTRLFEARYDYNEYNGWEIPAALGIDDERNIYVTGYSESDLGMEDYLTIKFSGRNGDTIWAQRYNFPGGDQDDAFAMVFNSYYDVFVTGLSYDPDMGAAITTVKYRKTGEQVWVARYYAPDQDDAYGYAIAHDSANNVYAVGTMWNGGAGEDYVTLKYSGADVGVSVVLEPSDTIRVNRIVEPKVMVRNYSPIADLTFPVRMDIGYYFFTAVVRNLGAYESTLVSFGSWSTATPGTFPVAAYTQLSGDEEPRNDTALGLVVAVLPWVTKPSVPLGLRNKNVKDGGALGYDGDRGNVYCLKGNNTLEFYAYNCSAQTWTSRESVPASASRKRVKKGSALAYGNNDLIYAAKGNRTTEFWAYDVVRRLWLPRTAVPGALKGTTGMAYAATQNRIYVLQGSNSQSFWAYSVAGDSWSTKAVLPLGISGKRPKDGTCIAYDGVSYIYALKGMTNEFFRYNINSDSWTQLRDIPKLSLKTNKKKKVANGGSMAFAAGMVHAFKGGNVNEFWLYNPPVDSWIEGDSMLMGVSRRRVKNGAALVNADGKLYALKGNNTLEFYMYNADIPWLDAAHGQPNEQAQVGTALRFGLTASPTLFRSQTQVAYALPRPGSVNLTLFDAAGRAQSVLASGLQPAGVSRVLLPARRLANGIYFLKLRYDDGRQEQQQTVKLLLQR